jgi:ATP-dependent RNA helicase RhlE
MDALRRVGFETPTPIQQKTIPEALTGQDVLGLAQTGTGKTAAFLLPILQRLIKGPRRKIRALIVAPTRELADQIFAAANDFAGKTGIRSMVIYGGVSKKPQLDNLRRGTEIVIACPGRLLDHVGEGDIDLSQVEVLVLDEADRMFDMGFLPDIRKIVAKVPESRQNLFFSATMPAEIRTLADQILKNPARVQIGIIAPAKTVSHALYPVPDDSKKELLYSLLERTRSERVLIFTRTKYRARSLAAALEKRGLRASALQGNMSQNARTRSISGFRSGQYDVLVATDIASRGLDISEISHVINFDIPDTADAYIHRIGRTGRVERSGDAFTLAVTEDAPMVREIEKVLGARIERRRLEGFDYGRFEPESQFRDTVQQNQRSRNPKPGPARRSPPARRRRR